MQSSMARAWLIAVFYFLWLIFLPTHKQQLSTPALSFPLPFSFPRPFSAVLRFKYFCDSTFLFASQAIVCAKTMPFLSR